MDWEFIDIATEFTSGENPPEGVEDAYHIVISDNEVLCVDGVHPWRPLNQDEWRWLGEEALVHHYLGVVAGTPIYATEVNADAEAPPGHDFETLWSFLGQVDEAVFYLIGRAKQIVEWHQHNKFCGQCGAPTQRSDSDRSLKCAECNLPFYPRLSPSITVLITRGADLLLAKNAQARGNFYSTIAGFVEPGETIEETVHREVREEVGVQVSNVTYFGSQSWPFPNSLMLGFHAEYAGGEIVLQEEEIADAQWFHYNELPNRPPRVSISGWLIDDYISRIESGQVVL